MAQVKTQWSPLPQGEGTFVKGTRWIDAMFLAVAGTAESYTVPAGVNRVAFSSPYNFWVRYDGSAAAVPSAEITNGSGAEMNPSSRSVLEGDVISFVASDANVPIAISCYS